jgi:hypothetical protein
VLPGPALLAVLAGASMFASPPSGGLGWVLREQRVVPPEVEHGLRQGEGCRRRFS